MTAFGRSGCSRWPRRPWPSRAPTTSRRWSTGRPGPDPLRRQPHPPVGLARGPVGPGPGGGRRQPGRHGHRPRRRPGAVRATARRAAEVARTMPPDPGYPGMPGPAAYPPPGGTTRPPPTPTRPPGPGWSPGRPPAPGRGGRGRGLRDPRAGDRPGQHPRGPGRRGDHRGQLLDPGRRRVGHRLGRGDRAGPGRPGRGRPRERAARKAVDSREPRELAPGTYPVVLEPNAASVMVQWLGWLGFGPRPTTRAAASWSAGSASGSARPWSRWSTTPPPPTPSASASTSRASPSGA